jgi:hypothetical protein
MHICGANIMMPETVEFALPSNEVLRAEQALFKLRRRAILQSHQRRQLTEFYRDWKQNWLDRSQQLCEQIGELEARVSPWLSISIRPQLSVMSPHEDAA